MILISVHLPKTAGSSFGGYLKKYFDVRLMHDYSDFPINTPVLKRKTMALRNACRNTISNFDEEKIGCIHGHFMPVKYLPLKLKGKATFVTWMRDPVERLASHYHFWWRNYDPEKSQALHRRVVEENWSLERFCFSPELRNFYSQFLWGFPLSFFNFIGIMENFEEDLSYFAQKFLPDMELIRRHGNKNPFKEGAHYISDAKFRSEIEAYHAKDMQLYYRVVELRKSRDTLIDLQT